MDRVITDAGRSLEEEVARARRYPFEQPAGSYLFTRDGTRPLGENELPAPGKIPPGFAGRTAVLAYASNASADALGRKFGALSDARIPVTACHLEGFDVVYSRHFYNGYIPATLTRAPGTVLHTFLTWLDPAEMRLMNDSEHLGINYELKPLAGGVARLESGFETDRPFAYQGLHGELMADSRPVALAGLDAEGRRLPELDQNGVLRTVQALIAPGLTVEQMVAAAISSTRAANDFTAALKRSQLPGPDPD